MNANFRIVVNNYNAQLKRTDPPGWYHTAEEAADKIVAMFNDRIGDEASEHADGVADFDEENDKWHAAYSEYFENVKRELLDGASYEDGDGHSYSVLHERDEIRTTRPVYSSENGHTLTPYVNSDGEIWLASEGNGCGNDVMLEDIGGWTREEINEQWSNINLDALLADAAEIRDRGDDESAEWIEDWCRTCERARTGEIEPAMIGDEATIADAKAVAEYLNDHGYNVTVSETDGAADCVPVPDGLWNAALKYACEKNGGWGRRGDEEIA